MRSPLTRAKPDFGGPEVRRSGRACARACSATPTIRATADSGMTANRISALLAQRTLEVVQQVLRAALALGESVVPIEVDALLDEAHLRAGAVGGKLERGERYRDAAPTDLHRVAPDDPLVGDDVVVVGVVAV